MRPISGGNSTVEVEGSTLRDVLAALDVAHNGFKDRLFDEAGDTVSIIPAVAGGF